MDRQRRAIRRLAFVSMVGIGMSAPATAVAQTRSSPFDHVAFFAGLDGSKQPQDLGVNANMGLRLSVNAGIPVVPGKGFGVQVGAALNVSDAAVHVLDQLEGTSRRTQTFVTTGVFQRLSRASWALAYDVQRNQYYDTFTLGQFRGEAAARLTSTDEVGIALNVGTGRTRGRVGDTVVELRPIAQGLGFVRRDWSKGGRTTLWAGVASEHHNQVLVIPDPSVDRHVFVYGARLDVPLNDRISISGSANLMTPAATGTVDAFLGMTIRASNARARERTLSLPLLEVANNPEMPIDLVIPTP
ncbi:MAG: DUF6666 family protein [Vicinamibacterales bacterium]